MMKVEDARIGQEVFYLDHDAYEVKTFVVKGIMQGYDQDEWRVCSELTSSSKCCLNVDECYASFPEATLALDQHCSEEIQEWLNQKKSIDLKIKRLQTVKDMILERCR